MGELLDRLYACPAHVVDAEAIEDDPLACVIVVEVAQFYPFPPPTTLACPPLEPVGPGFVYLTVFERHLEELEDLDDQRDLRAYVDHHYTMQYAAFDARRSYCASLKPPPPAAPPPSGGEPPFVSSSDHLLLVEGITHLYPLEYAQMVRDVSRAATRAVSREVVGPGDVDAPVRLVAGRGAPDLWYDDAVKTQVVMIRLGPPGGTEAAPTREFLLAGRPEDVVLYARNVGTILRPESAGGYAVLGGPDEILDRARAIVAAQRPAAQKSSKVKRSSSFFPTAALAGLALGVAALFSRR